MEVIKLLKFLDNLRKKGLISKYFIDDRNVVIVVAEGRKIKISENNEGVDVFLIDDYPDEDTVIHYHFVDYHFVALFKHFTNVVSLLKYRYGIPEKRARIFRCHEVNEDKIVCVDSVEVDWL